MSDPLITEYRIYDYMLSNIKTDVREINFKTELSISLVKKPTMVNGEPTEIIYYTDNNYLTPVVKIEFVFERDAFGFLTKKQRILKWYLKTGELSSVTKDISKYYDPLYDAASRVAENRLKRKNHFNDVLANMQLYLINNEGETECH